MGQKSLRVVIVIGCVVASGIGVWHFFFPTLYHCADYMVSAPAVVVNSILVINFSFSLLLTLFGAMGIIATTRLWNNKAAVQLFLWGTSIFAVIRFVYAIIQPLGIPIPGMDALFTVVFGLTALCFLVPAVALQKTAV